MIGTDDETRVDPRELTEHVRQRDRDLGAVEAGFIDDVMSGLRSSVWTADGHLSVHAWLRATTGWSDPRISRVVRNARLCRDTPQVLEMLREGRITIDRVDVLSRAHANPRVRPELVDAIDDFLVHAAGVSHRVFELFVRHWVNYIDIDGAHQDAETAHNNRSLVLSDGDDGTLVFHGQMSSTDAAEFRNILDAYTHAEHLIDSTSDQLPRTHRQRTLDALLRIARDAATHASTPDTDSSPAAGKVVVPEMIVHTDIATLTKLIELLHPTPDQTLALHGAGSLTLQQLNAELAAGLDPARLAAHTSDGQPLAPADLLAALILGKIRLVIHNEAGVIIHAGRSRRLFRGIQRDLVLAAATHCTFAGCNRRSTRCQADHLQPHSHDGPTNIDNGGPGCNHHNNWRHRNGYRITRDHHGHWHTRRPDGTEL